MCYLFCAVGARVDLQGYVMSHMWYYVGLSPNWSGCWARVRWTGWYGVTFGVVRLRWTEGRTAKCSVICWAMRVWGVGDDDWEEN
jgi:hypothetical protein